MASGVSVVIPTLNAESGIATLLDSLRSQTIIPDEILVVDSSSDDKTREIAVSYDGVRVHVIDRRDFDHGATRDAAFRMVSGEHVAFFTQDAVPANVDCLMKLLDPMTSDPRIAAVTGRQLPKEDTRRFERLVRGFNYPETSNVRSIEDVPCYGIKAFFMSDVCAVYRREPFLACDGFPHTTTNEDMLMAAKLLEAGYKVAYAADACVYHSHNLTPWEQFRRNRAIGHVMEENAVLLGDVSEMGEGAALVKHVTKQLLREGHIGELCAFGIDCIARLAGNRIGRQDARRNSCAASNGPDDR